MAIRGSLLLPLLRGTIPVLLFLLQALYAPVGFGQVYQGLPFSYNAIEEPALRPGYSNTLPKHELFRRPDLLEKGIRRVLKKRSGDFGSLQEQFFYNADGYISRHEYTGLYFGAAVYRYEPDKRTVRVQMTWSDSGSRDENIVIYHLHYNKTFRVESATHMVLQKREGRTDTVENGKYACFYNKEGWLDSTVKEMVLSGTVRKIPVEVLHYRRSKNAFNWLVDRLPDFDRYYAGKTRKGIVPDLNLQWQRAFAADSQNRYLWIVEEQVRHYTMMFWQKGQLRYAVLTKKEFSSPDPLPVKAPEPRGTLKRAEREEHTGGPADYVPLTQPADLRTLAELHIDRDNKHYRLLRYIDDLGGYKDNFLAESSRAGTKIRAIKSYNEEEEALRADAWTMETNREGLPVLFMSVCRNYSVSYEYFNR